MILFKNFLTKLQKLKIKVIINYALLSLIILFCALVSYLAHRVLILPSEKDAIMTGGLCGLSTIIAKVLVLFGVSSNFHEMFSHFNFLLNLPVLIMAFYFGFRFGFLTTLFILFNYVLHQIFGHVSNGLMQELANDFLKQGILTRIVIASFIDGFSEAIIISIGTSSGGISTICRYLTRKKDYRQLSKIILIFNSVILSLFSFLKIFDQSYNLVSVINSFIFAIMLSYLSKVFFDWFDFRGRKEQLQIITKNKDLITFIKCKNIHGATVVNAYGGYTNEEKIIIYTTVSVHETKNLVNLIKKYDQHCFINVIPIKQLHGQFLVRNLFELN